MSTPTQLFTARDTAGATYAAALAALKAAWIDLRSYDIACTSGRVLAAHPTGATKTPVYTFANASEWHPECLRHPVYAGAEYVNQWDTAAKAAADVLVANLS